MFTATPVATPSQAQFIVISTTLRLADGTRVILRLMQPEDVPALLEMHDRISSDSIYYRYLHPYRPTFKELDQLARLDRAKGAAFVPVLSDAGRQKVIGLGLYQREAGNRTAGQPAFLVEDEYQNRGLGRALAQLVIEHARQNGVQFLNALIHPENRRVMHLIDSSGMRYEAKLSYGAYEVRISLQDADLASEHVGGEEEDAG